MNTTKQFPTSETTRSRQKAVVSTIFFVVGCSGLEQLETFVVVFIFADVRIALDPFLDIRLAF